MMTTNEDRPALADPTHRVGWRTVGSVVVAFVLVAALELAAGRSHLKPYDEGLVLFGGWRVAHGDAPYLDFWSLYGPGSFYALGGLDRLFGVSVLTGRVFDAAIRAAAVLMVHALVAGRAGRPLGIVFAIVAALLLCGVREYLFPALPATVALTGLLWALRRALAEEADRRAWAVAGAAAGAVALFRPDFGAFAVLAALWAALAPPAPGRPRPRGSAVPLLAGFAAVGLPIYLWLLLRGAGPSMVEDLVAIPARVYVAMRSLPFPPPRETLVAALRAGKSYEAGQLLVYLPPLAAAWAVALAAGRRLGGAVADPVEAVHRRTFELATVFLVLLCIKGSVRPDAAQMFPALLVALVAAGIARPGRGWHGARGRRLAAAAGLLAFAGAVAAGVVLTRRADRFDGPTPFYAVGALRCPAVTRPVLGCFGIEPASAQVLDFLAAHRHAGDTLYVGAGRHDKLLINNIELYVLSDLPPATRWADLHPGVQTSAPIQREMIAGFERRPPAFVVRNTTWDGVEEPNASARSSGVTLLDDYLRAHYRTVFSAGTLSVAMPLGAASAPAPAPEPAPEPAPAPASAP